MFLRNHDELTLEMVTDEERDYMYRVYAHDPQARINLGIRRRLAPLLGNDLRQIQLMNALLFSMPGAPVLYYGDEIGMGVNVYLGDRQGVRTPMQWSGDRNGGFSRANPRGQLRSQQQARLGSRSPDKHHSSHWGRSVTLPTSALGRLARHLGVLMTYEDARGISRDPSAETLMAVLRTLGVDIDSPEQADKLLAQRRNAETRLTTPVIVVWDGAATTIDITAAEHMDRPEAMLVLESGETIELVLSPRNGGEGLQLLSTPGDLPFGYHELHVRVGATESTSTVLCAPRVAWTDPRRRWIGFLPLYALHSQRNPGMADLTDLAELGAWLKELGDGLIGTLPLLAGFLEKPVMDPSPYAPVSRLAWNELYVDTGSGAGLSTPKDGAGIRLIDYEEAYAVKRRSIAAAASTAHTNPESRAAMEQFANGHLGMADYCKFRAASSIIGEPWSRPAEEMAPLYGESFNELAQFHVYGQWQADIQLATVAERSAGLYLDYPIGVHARGFDSWRFPDQFVTGASAGAPPDDFYDGQHWGFQALKPRSIRDRAIEYLRASLSWQMRHASVLRFDHIMGLHRMYYIPDGFPMDQGAYVEYPAEELYAVLSLESHRHKTMLIGEDLGTVPKHIPKAMKEHGVRGMFVSEFDLRNTEKRLPIPVKGSLASIGTHDTPPFARWWRGMDIDDRQDLGLINPERSDEERGIRRNAISLVSSLIGSDSPALAHQALVDSLGESPRGARVGEP